MILFKYFNNRCRLCIKEVVPFLTVDIIDYRSKNSVVTEETNSHDNQESIDLLTKHKEKGILIFNLILFVLWCLFNVGFIFIYRSNK